MIVGKESHSSVLSKNSHSRPGQGLTPDPTGPRQGITPEPRGHRQGFTTGAHGIYQASTHTRARSVLGKVPNPSLQVLGTDSL